MQIGERYVSAEVCKFTKHWLKIYWAW